MTTMTTDMMSSSLLGRAREASMFIGGAPVPAVSHVGVDAQPWAAHAPATATEPTTYRTATAVATNPWLGGSGFGDGTGVCSTTVVDDSTKRIHPRRLEGMT